MRHFEISHWALQFGGSAYGRNFELLYNWASVHKQKRFGDI